eukprot:1144913-Pelagomonas_calceolata.AAC.1
MFSAELVPFDEPRCALGLHVCTLSQPNTPPVCPNPPAAPPSLQVNPRMSPECPGGHLLRGGWRGAGGGLLWEVLQSQLREVLTIARFWGGVGIQVQKSDFFGNKHRYEDAGFVSK